MITLLASILVLATCLAAAIWVAWQRTKDLHRSKLILASMQETLASRSAELGKALDQRTPVPATKLRQHIRAMRKAKGWTQAALARRMGVQVHSVVGYESSESLMMGDTAVALATAFGEPIVVSYEPVPKIEKPVTKKPTPRIEPKPTKKRKPDPLVELDAAVRDALCDELSESPITVARDDGRYHISQELWNDERIEYIALKNEPFEQIISKLHELKQAALVNPYSD